MKKGISLIALIITIIVIIILAVITIFGVNGVVEKAREAKILQEISNEKEIVSAAVVQAKKEINSFNEETLGKAMDNITGVGETYVFTDSDNLAVQFKKSERYYLVDKAGAIEGPIEKVEDEYAGDITKNGKYDGSEDKPYQINCIEDLVAFSIMSHGGNTELGLKSVDVYNYVELVRTLDFQSMLSYNDYTTMKYGDLNTDGVEEDIRTELTKKDEGCIGFTPIAFTGYFEGNGNTIKNLYLNDSADNDLGLFANWFAAVRGAIRNLSITGEIINTNWGASGFGQAYAFYNCKNYANVTGCNYVGGITGHTGTTTVLENCENYGTITMITPKARDAGAGGIVGTAEGTRIENCRNYGNVRSSFVGTDEGFCGGIVGKAGSQSPYVTNVINCVNYSDNVCGGIVGMFWDNSEINVIDCYNLGNCIGGIVADSYIYYDPYAANIINCYNLGECESGIVDKFRTDWYDVEIKLNMKNCYNFGKVKNGLIGLQHGSGNNSAIIVNIENCCNYAESEKGVVGNVDARNASVCTTNITNTYYNASKATDMGVITDGVTGVTDEEMRNQKTVADTGKTLVEILNENIGDNENWKKWKVGENGYPVFVSE